jgi:hypothetical protein
MQNALLTMNEWTALFGSILWLVTKWASRLFMIAHSILTTTKAWARCSSELNRLIKNTKYSYPEWNGTETANRIVDVFDVHEALL